MNDDSKSLQELVLQQQELIKKLEWQNAELLQQINLLRKKIYGSTSEAMPLPEGPSSQLDLFGEDQPEATAEEKAEEAREPARPRRRGSRRPLPKELPRKEIMIDILEDEATCTCGRERVCIGEDRSERLCYIPGRLLVEVTVRRRFACKTCKDSVVQAPLPPHILPRAGAGVSLLVHLIVGKYMDHLPLCRMEGIFARNGIDIDRGLMCDWLMKVSERLLPLVILMTRRLMGCHLLGVDETPIKMQGRKGRSGLKKCYVWVYNGDEQAPFTVYDFQQTRGRDGPADILRGFGQVLQSDGYSVYQSLEKSDDYSFRRAGCMAHVRRKFVEALDGGDVRAKDAITFFQQLYAVEKQASDLSVDARRDQRQEHAAPVIAAFHAWLLGHVSALPKSPLGKAIGYALDNWKEVTVYLEDGRIPIDNNAVERAIRPIALGRKNWLFVGSPRGGQAAAIFLSLLNSATRHGHNPNVYLTDLLERLPTTAEQDLPKLLPDAWTPAAK